MNPGCASSNNLSLPKISTTTTKILPAEEPSKYSDSVLSFLEGYYISSSVLSTITEIIHVEINNHYAPEQTHTDYQ